MRSSVARLTAVGIVGAVLAVPFFFGGQPNQSCEEQTTAPAGFSTSGFANAQSHYADGSHNDKAVSQYDVACYQLSNH